MSMMKDLVTHIEEFSNEDERLAGLLKWIIDEHIQGRVPYDNMPTEAKYCFGSWEQEQKLMQDADDASKVYEIENKQRIHDNIQHAVEEGRITYDQGMELIINPEEADRWDREGII